MDGRETVGNSLGRAQVGRSDTGVTRGVDGRGIRKRQETVGNSLGRAPRWEGAIRENDDRVDGRETVGNSLGRAPWGRGDTEATRGWTGGNRGK